VFGSLFGINLVSVELVEGEELGNERKRAEGGKNEKRQSNGQFLVFEHLDES